MPPLIAFVLKNFVIGAVLGLAAAGALVWGGSHPLGGMLGNGEPAVALVLLAVGVASTFGLGYLATALVLDEG